MQYPFNFHSMPFDIENKLNVEREFYFSTSNELNDEVVQGSPEYIRWIQSSLNKILKLRLVEDGAIGVKTRSALRRFQQQAGIRADGNFSTQTEQALVAAGASKPPGPSTTLSNGFAGPAVAGVAPELIKREDSPANMSLYVNIPLGSENPAKPMTGIFIPQNFRPQPQVDLILYLHGFKLPSGLPLTTTIDKYWCAGCKSPFTLRERVNESGKNVILVAPTLGAKSGTGRLVEKGGLDSYLDKVLAALTAYGPFRGSKTLDIGNLILASHSGGGLPMRTLALSGGRYSKLIKECWGFDCTYNGGDDSLWAQWAKSHHDSKLFIYYIRGSQTAIQAESLKRKRVANVFVLPATVSHNHIPNKYWRERLQAADFLKSV